MKAILIAILALTGVCAGAQQQKPKEPTWGELLDSGKPDAARKLCTGWLSSDDVPKKVEAYKCLANVELCGKGVVFLQGDDVGGGTLGSSYDPEAANKALAYLEDGLKLAPQDLSIHQGRLHILEATGRYSDMAKALEESCSVYKGHDGLEAWLAYTDELFEANQLHASLSLLRVLEKHFPDSHDVVGNIGAVLSQLKQDDEAVQYLNRAVELAPSDPIDNWNLARLYDFMGEVDLADAWYQKALPLDSDPDRKRGNTCLYASFVARKLHDQTRACKLQMESCDPKEQTACSKSK